MAVQAQYPSIAFRNNAYVNNNTVLEENFHQDHHHLQYHGHHHHHQVLLIKNGTVFSDPESELTCNFVSASTTTRKRKNSSCSSSTRGGGGGGGGDDQMPHQYLNPQHQENVLLSHNYNYNYLFPSSRITKLPKIDQFISKKSFEENRLNQQQSGGGGEASTSGRRRRYHDDEDEDAVLLVSSSSPQVPPPLPQQHSQHLNSSSSYSYLLHQNLDDDIDTLIRLQHEALRSVVEQTQQRQCRLLVSVLEQQVQIRLKEKQIELENALGRNADLEEKVKQMSSENQMWFNVAKNNEAMVLSLRSTLEHQLLLNLHHHHQNQNATMGLVGLGGGGGQGAKLLVEEGFGDSSDGVADDAQLSNNNNCHQQLQVNVVGEREYKTVNSTSNVDVRDDDDDASMMMMMMKEHQHQHQHQQHQHRKMCKVCKEMEVSVLLLPCRHLCLCKDCEPKLQACPICNSFKNASLQIFMS